MPQGHPRKNMDMLQGTCTIYSISHELCMWFVLYFVLVLINFTHILQTYPTGTGTNIQCQCNMHMVCNLLFFCCEINISWFYPYPSRVLPLHWGKHITPVPPKQHRRKPISHESTIITDMTRTKQITTKLWVTYMSLQNYIRKNGVLLEDWWDA